MDDSDACLLRQWHKEGKKISCDPFPNTRQATKIFRDSIEFFSFFNKERTMCIYSRGTTF